MGTEFCADSQGPDFAGDYRTLEGQWPYIRATVTGSLVERRVKFDVITPAGKNRCSKELLVRSENVKDADEILGADEEDGQAT